MGAWSVHLADLLVRASTPRHLEIAAVALAADGSFALFEGWALRRGFAWAPWVIVVASACLFCRGGARALPTCSRGSCVGVVRQRCHRDLPLSARGVLAEVRPREIADPGRQECRVRVTAG